MDAQAQLEGFIDKFTPQVAALARALIERMKTRVPGATLLVYDNYNALAIGFGPGDKSSQAVLSLAVYPRWVNLFFLQGAELPDPDRLLQGAGSRVRHIRLDDDKPLDDPRVDALIAEALARAAPPIDPSAEERLLIKSALAKQRPRRPA